MQSISPYGQTVARNRKPPMNADSQIRTDAKTILAIVTATAAGVWAWQSVRGEVAAHTEQLQAIQGVVKADHDALMVQGSLLQQQGSLLEKMDRKLDYVSGASRTRPPATIPNQ